MSINNLEELINKINKMYPSNKNFNSLENIVESYNGTDWINYIINGINSPLSNHKNYYKNLVYKNNFYDVYIISWMPNKKSTIHDHSNNGCIYKILRGNIKENRYSLDNIKLISSENLNINDCGYISNNMFYHQMINLDNDISVSLHVYSPPNYKTRSFNS